MIGLPPSDAGIVKLTVACPLPATAVTAVGALGNALGVTLLDDVEAGPGPKEFVATTVNL